MSPSVRAQLVEALTPLLPETWELVPTQRTIDTLDGVLLMISQRSIQRAPAAPQGAHLTTFVLTVIDPQTDPERAEDALDDEVQALIFALNTIPALKWTEATKVLWQERHFAYDISLEIITGKDTAN